MGSIEKLLSQLLAIQRAPEPGVVSAQQVDSAAPGADNPPASFDIDGEQYNGSNIAYAQTGPTNEEVPTVSAVFQEQSEQSEEGQAEQAKEEQYEGKQTQWSETWGEGGYGADPEETQAGAKIGYDMD